MTEPRKPLVLDFLEWKTLVMHGLAEMNQAVQGSSTIDASGIAWADAKWADIRTRLVGWENYSRPVIAQQQKQAAEQQSQQPVSLPQDERLFMHPAEVKLEGAEVVDELERSRRARVANDPAKKRGGWPAGKPRGPRKPKPAVAPPAVSM